MTATHKTIVAVVAMLIAGACVLTGKVTVTADMAEKLVATSVGFFGGWLMPQSSLAKGKSGQAGRAEVQLLFAVAGCAVALAFAVLASCRPLKASDVNEAAQRAREAAYYTEGVDCVARYPADAGDKMKECWRDVDARYGQLDAGDR